MNSVTLAIVGSGGAGVVSLGELVLKAAANVGYYGLMRKSFGPQIRGGESAAIIRLSTLPVENFTGDIHCVVALDWNNFSRFGDEIPVNNDTLVIQDTLAGAVPDSLNAQTITTLDFSGTAKAVGSSKANMAALGLIGALLNCDQSVLERLIRTRLAKFDEAIQAVSVAAMAAGQSLFDAESFPDLLPTLDKADASNRWIATGNQLAGLGALEAGVKFVAAYPITPASDCLEWIANHIESEGGHLVQAEDELAAVNMIIGAGFAGVPSMTATSGPGLSLMSEAMGLAVASETPTVILNVMRGGPSTGIPTKSEQSDLNLALYGMHGDAPHIVLSALSVEDCFATMAWAVSLATELQTLVIVLSDQFIGQSMQVINALPETPFKANLQNQVHDAPDGYARYLDTDSGVSPMAIPGSSNGMYTADGLEHTEAAVPSPKMNEHQKQLDKRQRKLERYDFGDFGIESKGSAEHVVLCWGSLHGSALEAQQLLQEKGVAIRVISLRQLAPLPLAPLMTLIKDASSVLVVEQNHQGQFSHYLRAQGIPGDAFTTLAQAGPTLITPQQIATIVEQKITALTECEGADS